MSKDKNFFSTFPPIIPSKFDFDFAEMERRIIALHLPAMESALTKVRRRKIEGMAQLRAQSVMHRKRTYAYPPDVLVRLKLCKAILEVEKGVTDASVILCGMADSAVRTFYRHTHRRLL